MPRRRTDTKEFAHWVDWSKAVKRVRRAKTDELAIEALKRYFKTAAMLFEGITTEDLSRKIRRERITEHARERVESMARAMANASEREDEWKEFIPQARALDAALHARRIYET